MPSPSEASVDGQRPATAPVAASAAHSAAFICVAWIRHQRASTGALSSSHCTGRAPVAARHSATSFACSAAWMCIGPGRAATRLQHRSGVTARRLCGAMPMAASRVARGRGAAGLDDAQIRLEVVAGSAAAPAPGRAPKMPPWRYSTGQQGQADARVRRAAATMPQRHLGDAVIGRAVGLVVQVVELGDAV